MRHLIKVIGSRAQETRAVPRVVLRDGETLRETVWYACGDQENPSSLLDDSASLLLRIVRAPFLAYDLYQKVHNTKLWSGKRPLVLVLGRSMSSRVAARAARWGGGDVVMPAGADKEVLGPTRYLLLEDGSLELRAD